MLWYGSCVRWRAGFANESYSYQWMISPKRLSSFSGTRLTVRTRLLHEKKKYKANSHVRSRCSIRGAAPQRHRPLSNYGQRQNTVGKHPTDRGIHVLGCPSARLRRRYPLAQSIRLECARRALNARVIWWAETAWYITCLATAFFEDKTGFYYNSTRQRLP